MRKEVVGIRNQVSKLRITYTDGLSGSFLDCEEVLSLEIFTACLAKPTRLFKAPLMPLRLLNLHATQNLGRSMNLIPDDKRVCDLPDHTSPRLFWKRNAVTRHYPHTGQPTLFFHSVRLMPILRACQEEIVKRLEELSLFDSSAEWNAVARGQRKPLFASSLIEELTQAVANCRKISAKRSLRWEQDCWGAVPLLLRHVDPDLLIALLPVAARKCLLEEIQAWQNFVRDTLKSSLEDKNQLLHPVLRSLKVERTPSGRRGDTSPTFEELERIPSSDFSEKPLVAEPLLPGELFDDADFDFKKALTQLVDWQIKIVRRALENARRLMDEGFTPDGIVGVTVDELGAELRQIGRDQIRAVLNARKPPKPKQVSTKAKKASKGSLAALGELLDGCPLTPELKKLATQYLGLEQELDARPDRSIDPMRHDSFMKNRKRLWKKIEKTAERVRKRPPLETDSTGIQEIFDRAQDKRSNNEAKGRNTDSDTDHDDGDSSRSE